MKKIIYIPIIAIALMFFGCGEDFLLHENLYEVSDESYFSTPEEINDALIAAYACLPMDGGVNNPTLVANLMSDDCFGGGGINDVGFHSIDGFENLTTDLYSELWLQTYRGIFRVNTIIKRFDQAEYTDEDAKNQALGEAYFLRAYFYHRLAKFFGNVPLKTEPIPDNLPKAPADDIYAQIAFDLKTAIDIMPATKVTAIPETRLGHATKWAAEALMARIFLFYTGYYNKTEIVTAGGTISKQQVIDWLNDLIDNSGHDLIPDFRNLWPYSYANGTEGGWEYPYARNNNLNWIGEDGDNIETIFAIKYSPYGGWNEPNKMSYSNQLCLYMALRGQDGLMPYGTGWGGGPVNPQLYDSFDDNDIRKKGSIVDITDPEEGNVSTDYVWGQWEAMHETGLGQKKYTPIQVAVLNESTGNYQLRGMYFDLLGTPTDFQLWNMQDEVLIRFADVLLMAAELSNDAEPLNRVRTRAGLGSVSYSLEILKEERRHELAFEGIRYFDLLRWQDAEQAFAIVKDVPVRNVSMDDTYTAKYRPETGGFLPIPETEINLSEGVLEQNKGW